MAAPVPPYNPHDLTVPLTSEQRSTMIGWLPLAAVWATMNGWSGSFPKNYSTMSDTQLAQVYTAYYDMVTIKAQGITLNPVQAIQEAGITNPLTGQTIQNPITSIEQFLTLLTSKNLWIRVAEFAVGGAILIVGVNAALRPGTSISSTVKKAVIP